MKTKYLEMVKELLAYAKLNDTFFLTGDQFRDFEDEVEDACEKQIAKEPILIQHPQPDKRDFRCPVCSGDVNRQWEYEYDDDSMIGEDLYEYCPDCGTKINWREEI